jgi:hypothetical protein
MTGPPPLPELTVGVRFPSPAPRQRPRSDAHRPNLGLLHPPCVPATYPFHSGSPGHWRLVVADEHRVEGVGSDAVPGGGGVLVDDRGTGAAVAHPRHQLAGAGVRGSERVAGASQVVQAQAWQPPAATRSRQRVVLSKLLRRSADPLGPTNSNPSGPGWAYSARCVSRSGSMSRGKCHSSAACSRLRRSKAHLTSGQLRLQEPVRSRPSRPVPSRCPSRAPAVIAAWLQPPDTVSKCYPRR